MKNNFNYCGVQPTPTKREFVNNNHTNDLGSDRPYQKIGDRILFHLETGENLGESFLPSYDEPNISDIDITTSFRHDAIDIAEEFGKMPDIAQPAPTSNEPSSTTEPV